MGGRFPFIKTPLNAGQYPSRKDGPEGRAAGKLCGAENVLPPSQITPDWCGFGFFPLIPAAQVALVSKVPASREILIVHPDAKVRNTLSFLLEDLGFKVRAGDRIPPRSAVIPELAIVELPAGGSHQLAVDLRHTYPEPRLIVLVKEPTVPQLLGLFDLNVARCYPEPIKVEAILATIRELLPEPEPAPEPFAGGATPPFPVPPVSAPPIPVSQTPFAQTAAPFVAPTGRAFVRPSSSGETPSRLFGLPEEDRFLDPVERRLADFKGFRGPLAIVASDKPAADRAARKLARMALNRDGQSLEPVGLSAVRKSQAEGKAEGIYIVRSAELVPPSDREWLAQLVGMRESDTPRVILCFGAILPEWVRVHNISTVRLPGE